MNARALLLLLPCVLSVPLVSGPLAATVVELETIEQPVNLGALADPSRIPLGPVVVETNHGYDRHGVITLPRPCTHGALLWKNGQELNMNLASAFGMDVVPEDPTQILDGPVTIKVRNWPKPAYTPYRKDQVLAAILHCLLRSTPATPKVPLKIVIDAENPEDAKNLAGFAGTYFTRKADEHGGPTPVPGTRLETDSRGVTYVVLDQAKAPSAEALRRPPPVLIPFGHLDDEFFTFIPVWTGDSWQQDRRKIIAQPITLFYDRFNPTTSFGPDVNALSRVSSLSQYEWFDTVEGTRLWVSLVDKNPQQLGRTLAALCHAVILTIQPGAQTPLTIDIEARPGFLDKHLAAFQADKHWTLRNAPEAGRRFLSCKFVWDPNKRKLSRGAVPVGRMRSQGHHAWTLSFPPDERAADLQE